MQKAMVDRQTILDYYMTEKLKGKFIYSGSIVEYIESLPCVWIERTWIKCSERLPEYYKTVLVTLNDNSVCIMSRVVLFLSNDDVWEDENGDFVQMDEVKAWMPLPDPYEVGGE